MHPRLVLVHLAKDRSLVLDRLRSPAEEAGCQPRRPLRKCELCSRQNADRRRDILRRGETTRAGAEVTRCELVADLGWSGLDVVQAIIAHRTDSSGASPPIASAPLFAARQVPFLWQPILEPVQNKCGKRARTESHRHWRAFSDARRIARSPATAFTRQFESKCEMFAAAARKMASPRRNHFAAQIRHMRVNSE